MNVLSPQTVEPVELMVERHEDERGFFSETWSAARLRAAGIEVEFIQDNHANSRKGVLRGLHYQLAPRTQDKLVRVARGAAFCAAVDIRRSSPTFAKSWAFEISADRWNQLFVPKGFAFGYLAIEDDTDLLYKVSAPYAPDLERSIRFDDPEIGIAWPSGNTDHVLSARDRAAPPLWAADVL